MKPLLSSLAAFSLLIALIPAAPLHAQAPDSARYRIYITVTDSITGKSARASFGFHPRATIAVDYDTLFGFRDHWYERDSSWLKEYYSPPVGFFQELRINNVRQKEINSFLFGNIHRYTGPSMVDTFIVTFTGDYNQAGDSDYSYTHPQILSWPSVLRSYADSIILRDISNNQQTVAGPYIHVDLTQNSSFTYFGDLYFNADISIYYVDPKVKGFFLCVYHPKISPPPPDPVVIVYPSNDTTVSPPEVTLIWEPVGGARSYKVEIDTASRFTFMNPLISHDLNATSDVVGGLAPNTRYYWRVLVSTDYGLSYGQDPPNSFRTTAPTDGREAGREVPAGFALLQNYPNPFNPSTTVSFDVARASSVTLRVYDLLGREVATIAEGVFQSGEYRRSWDAAGFPSGVYFYKLQASYVRTAAGVPAGTFRAYGKMLLTR